MKTNKNQKSMNNKGFSLVELIVVVAIMAVLVAVLAPQFTKYIDRSRQSNDAATVSGIVTAAEVGVADTVDYNIAPGVYVITVGESTTGVTTEALAEGGTAPSPDGMIDAIQDACGDLNTLTRTANEWQTDIVIRLTYTNDGAVEVTYEPDAFANYIDKPATTPDN